MQVYDAATNAGADDIVPALDEDEQLEGYKVGNKLALASSKQHCAEHSQHPSAFNHVLSVTLVGGLFQCFGFLYACALHISFQNGWSTLQSPS